VPLVVALIALLAIAAGWVLARARRLRKGPAEPPWVRQLKAALDQTQSWPCTVCKGRIVLEGSARDSREEMDAARRAVRRSFGAVCERCGSAFHVILRAQGGAPVVIEAEIDRVDLT
jgi:hypothetical protein